MHKFVSLKEAFETNPGLNKIRDVVKRSDVIGKFYVVFPEMEKVVEAVSINKKVLLLRVENSVLRSELKLNESLMVERINRYFNEERVKSIRFI